MATPPLSSAQLHAHAARRLERLLLGVPPTISGTVGTAARKGVNKLPRVRVVMPALTTPAVPGKREETETAQKGGMVAGSRSVAKDFVQRYLPLLRRTCECEIAVPDSTEASPSGYVEVHGQRTATLPFENYKTSAQVMHHLRHL